MHKTSSKCCAIFLVTDRLSLGMLGAYGNAWVDTPCFDALAFESCVFDQAFLATPTLRGFYDSVWLGCEPGIADSQQQSLPELLAVAGVATLLITDEPAVTTHSAAEAFGQMMLIESESNSPAAEDARADAISPVDGGIENTCLGRFFAIASEKIAELEGPTVVWLHTRGMAAAWDAPYAMREVYAAEQDPDPPTWRKVPCDRVTKQSDPDVLLGVVQAYAGQVALWDTCLGVLTDAIDANAIFKDALFSVVSCRGFPLGEHHCIGAGGEEDDDLYGELLHIPLACRFPGKMAAVRSPSLVQPVDLYEIVQQWSKDTLCGEAKSPESYRDTDSWYQPDGKQVREFALSQSSQGAWAIRTPAWFLRSVADPSAHKELYVKPDDRWEVNDIADCCREVVEQLEKIYDEAIHNNRVSPLNELLLEGMN